MQSFCAIIDIIVNPLSIRKKTVNQTIRPNDQNCTIIVFKDLLTLFLKLYHQYSRSPEKNERVMQVEILKHQTLNLLFQILQLSGGNFITLLTLSGETLYRTIQ